MACCGNNSYAFSTMNSIFNVSGITCGCGSRGFVPSAATASTCCNVSAMQSVNAMFDSRLDRDARRLIGYKTSCACKVR